MSVVERGARAIYEADPTTNADRYPWDSIEAVPLKDRYRAMFRAALGVGAASVREDAGERALDAARQRGRAAAAPREDAEGEVCAACRAGEGGVCHTPGCRYWMCDAPSHGDDTGEDPVVWSLEVEGGGSRIGLTRAGRLFAERLPEAPAWTWASTRPLAWNQVLALKTLLRDPAPVSSDDCTEGP